MMKRSESMRVREWKRESMYLGKAREAEGGAKGGHYV